MKFDSKESINTINSFMHFMDSCKEQQKTLINRLIEIEKERDDSLHRIELICENYYELAKEALNLKDVLLKRRETKDAIQQLNSIVEWYSKQSPALSQLVSRMTKVMHTHETRHYVCRVDGQILTSKKKEQISEEQIIQGQIFSLKEV